MFETFYAGLETAGLLPDSKQWATSAGFLGAGMISSHGPIPMSSTLYRKPKSSYGDKDGTGSQFLFVCQVDLVRANLLRTQ